MFKFVSILDDDLYKFTMQQAILKQYPDAEASYKFINRGPHRFNEEFLIELKNSIHAMRDLSLTDDEHWYLETTLPFLSPWYLEFLSSFRYNSGEIQNIKLTEDNNLQLDFMGPWYTTVLWEVKLMAMISEIYFQTVVKNWNDRGVSEKATSKGESLDRNHCIFADFGTRRRRSYQVQKEVVTALRACKGFVGTSNVFLSFLKKATPIGTMAHEWIQGISALESMNHPNRFMLQKWAEVYEGFLGIALTDTYGSESFFKDFNTRYSKLFDGIRHDSGDPFKFIDKAVAHYDSKKIDRHSKKIIFSDGLDVKKAIEIKKYCNLYGIGSSFGIGTHFTNDFEGSPALNMVIKLQSINGIPVVKLSDEPGKVTGDPEMVGIMKKIHLK